jgi:hypothetical protein
VQFPSVALEERKAFAVGHLALGYILGKASSKLLKTNISVPAVLTLSVISDVDILIPFVQHRGPVHSVVVAFAVFVPFFVVYRRKAVPYFMALLQHSLPSDFVAGGRIQLFWPLTTQYYGIETSITSPANIGLEWFLFVVSMAIMFKAGDIRTFFKPHLSNLVLSVPTVTVLLPTFLSFPLYVPVSLIPPHVVYMILFIAAITISLVGVFKERF